MIESSRERALERAVASIPRCVRCVLPITAPFLELDAEGVCRHCRAHRTLPVRGEAALQALADRIRRDDGNPDCLVALSGGRDSCYVLHHVTRVLGLHPLAFTYDWGFTTPLGKANQERMCRALDVPRVDLTEDLARRRADVRANVTAWLGRPRLGMVPLVMAGDKPFFFHAARVRKRHGLATLFFGMAEDYENEDFKEGFCGARTEGRQEDKRSYRASPRQVLRVAAYYAGNFLRNPAYLNRSLARTAFAAFAYYVMPHGYFTNLFAFVEWDERTVAQTLRSEYGWESPADNASTWRAGDAAAAFINHVYLCVAGFTENDFLRSNQVRRGVLSRGEALALVLRENRVHHESLAEFLALAGLDRTTVVDAIWRIRPLYGRDVAA